VLLARVISCPAKTRRTRQPSCESQGAFQRRESRPWPIASVIRAHRPLEPPELRGRGLAPDVALLDIGLPEMDGYELARRMRASPELQHVRLIALTGYGQPADRRRGEAAGFDAYLVKPVELSTLQRTLVTEHSSSW
jgi:CheY-like chemotaxis protein